MRAPSDTNRRWKARRIDSPLHGRKIYSLLVFIADWLRLYDEVTNRGGNGRAFIERRQVEAGAAPPDAGSARQSPSSKGRHLKPFTEADIGRA